ncbi:MAG: metallophosphoesterase [Lachnospiraceae bacterium]|nr:metallophosphoesterase [Lachnospiraceae bacterium]
MVALMLSPVYILVNIYILRWLLKWMGACSGKLKTTRIRVTVVLIYSFFALAILIGFLLPQGQPRRIMKLIGNYWLGVTLYMVLTVILADIIRIILRHCRKINQEKLRSRKTFVIGGGVSILIIAAVSIGGVINARYIRTTSYDLTVEKSGGELSDLNIVLVADLHLGYNIGCAHMEQMVEKINAQNPDLVVIAGDIFDNEYEALDDPDRLISIFQQIQSKYGVYACYGNHDIQEKILAGFTFHSDKKKESSLQMDELLEKSNITLLKDEYVLIDNSFYLYGRPDAERPNRGIEVRKTPQEITAQLDNEKPIIVIDHEPRELQELADAGVDLDLCGHTHDGQLFPANYTTKLMWENSYGYEKRGQMQNIVTSGVGLFGPNMRVGTIPEVCDIQVQFDGGAASAKE